MKLIDHVLKIRGLIQQAIDNRFSRLGLQEEAMPVETLSDEQQPKRRVLDTIIATHQAAMGNYAEARKEAIKECVFTLFNRLAAVKVMEDRELFPEVIRRRAEHGNLSYSHKMWLEEHPEERTAERMGLKNFLRDKFAELFDDFGIPLFKADHPYAILPTADELDEIITAFNSIELDEQCGEDIWKGDDILGWMYENFNAVEKVQLKESGEKIEYDKVFLQSQIYTPQWVVKFLVDNTLGKQYLEMYPDSRFMIDEETGKTKYLIANAPKQQVRHPKENGVLDIKLIDPACGSGNFLIYAFSVFYDMYVDQMENYGADFSRRDIPKLIVEHNLYGVDLDERAVQITQIALFIKAMQLKGRRGKMPTYCNVVSSHFSLPDYETIEATFEMGDAHWDEKQREVIKDIWNDLCNAHKFGSLLRLKEKIEAMMPKQERNLFYDYQIHDFFSFKNQAIEMLRKQVHQWGGEGSNAYSLSLVNDAMTFLDILTTSFDVAVANPPYTDSSDFGPELKEFAEANYKKPMKFNINLYACFIKRCCELTDELGKVGMVNPPTFMYIKTFEDARKYMVEKTHISLFVEWGYLGMFSPSARVDSAFFILDKNKSKEDSLFIKLNDLYEMKRKKVLFDAYADYCNGQSNDRVYLLPQDKLKAIKSWPFIYWISDEFREKFGMPSVDKYMNVVKGLTTSDNNRFLRFWWEIEKSNVSDSYKEDRQMVLDKEGIPVGDLSVSQAALEAYKAWLKEENTEFPASAEVWEYLDSLAIDNEQPQISDFEKLYQNNYGWEEFCNSDNHRMNPIEVWYQFRHAGVLPPQRTQSLCFELITDVIRAILKKDDDGVIPLCERMGEEPLDVRIEQELVERGYSGAQISQIEQLLCMNLGTGKSLRKYLYEKFFQQLSDHLNLFMYLPKTPFIWHLTSGDPASGHSAIDLYVSIYTWSRDTLFRIKSVYLANRESGLSNRLAAIDPTTANGKIEAAEIKDQLQELHQFADKIDALLASGYNPKLDDGVGKNIAPLQKAGLLSYEVLNSGQLKKYLNADW